MACRSRPIGVDLHLLAAKKASDLPIDSLFQQWLSFGSLDQGPRKSPPAWVFDSLGCLAAVLEQPRASGTVVGTILDRAHSVWVRLFWNDTGRRKSESRGWCFGHFVELTHRLYHTASLWDLVIHAAPWIRKAPWPSWPHRRGLPRRQAVPTGKDRVRALRGENSAANERKFIQEKSTRMSPPLGVLSGVHSKPAKFWVLGLWSPCTRRLCASNRPGANL